MTELLIKKKSEIHGIGIFANKNIKKRDVFYKLPIELISNKPKPRWACIGKNRWVSDEEILNYINHSCDPNSILCVSPQPKIIAKRNINSGEEITVDYNLTEINGKRVKCACKSENCRGYFLRIE